MISTGRLLAGALGVAVSAVIVFDTIRIVRALRVSEVTAANSTPFRTAPAQPLARLLVIGDSTAAGTGARNARLSVAGRISEAYPRTHVDNGAVVGARIQDLHSQLDAAGNATYDALLIQVGGNDILRFTTLSRVEDELDAVFARAKKRSQHVAVIPPGDVGAAPAIPWPVSALYSYRSGQVRQRIAIIAGLRDVAFVDLTVAPSTKSPFERNPKKNYSDDGLHPSGKGYGHWYAALADQVPLSLWLERRSADPSALHHD